MIPSRRRLLAIGLGLAFAGLASAERAYSQTVLPQALRNVGFDQRLNEQVPLDLSFTDDQGEHVRLAKYFGQKPVVLVLAYYRCPMLCTQVLNGLVQGLREMPFTVGKEFGVVTVSFDPNETTEMAAAKKRTYVHSYGKPESADGWHFLTGDLQSISRLTHAVGFRYAYDAQSDQFAHAAGIVILTPAGKISRYFYDVHYSGRDLRLGLVEASQNRSVRRSIRSSCSASITIPRPGSTARRS